jgi:hypothetical protein
VSTCAPDTARYEGYEAATRRQPKAKSKTGDASSHINQGPIQLEFTDSQGVIITASRTSAGICHIKRANVFGFMVTPFEFSVISVLNHHLIA